MTTLCMTFAACSDPAGPPLASVAGTYLMTGVSGPGPVSGSITLTSSGDAERRVRYRSSSGVLSSDYVAIGVFQTRTDGTIDLRLREDGGQSQYVWQPLTELRGRVLTVSSLDPADGPNIVETYERQ